MSASHGFSRGRQGRVQGQFAALEADLIRHLVSQVVELMGEGVPAAASAADRDRDPIAELLELNVPSTPPEDPVLQRLLPDAYRDDDEAAGDFRRFTERSLRGRKSDNGRVVIDSLTRAGLSDQVEAAAAGAGPADATGVEVELDADEAQAWLRALTDVRLALATRLGVEEGDDDYWDALPADDPRAYLHDVYDWLGFVQETLVAAVART